jgi:hypothetical protein
MLRNKIPFGRKVSVPESILCGAGSSNVAEVPPAPVTKVAFEDEQLMSKICDALRPLVNEKDEMLVWRRPFRWHCDRGVIPNGYEMFGLDELAEYLNMEVVHDFRHVGVLRRRV